ncbi:MAG: bifunctional enoyl-CoA hydratase/phosphate acetyltransferase [Alphaproteobacteria bacterium]|nr:bifunctional enoyl-CoA hydratase/phosphate acetyltransferase [Alphaproteobacteria bacterium]
MSESPANLDELIGRAKMRPTIRVAVVEAHQALVVKAVHEATLLGLIEATLIGNRDAILKCTKDVGLTIEADQIIGTTDAAAAARKGVELVKSGHVDAVMKGNIHTDIVMRALLDSKSGLRVPFRRVSHVFLVDVPTYPKLLAVTDAAINIAPDLMAKAQILENAIELLHLIGVETPKAAVLSAVETINPAIVSTLDAAGLTMMSSRGQIAGAIVDGPFAFDNAISKRAAREKGIVSEVAGDADILLVPDLISGNILAKCLEYLAGATAAGMVMGLSVPVVLSSRADPPAARLAALAIAVLIHRVARDEVRPEPEEGSAIHCAVQPESACCRVGV